MQSFDIFAYLSICCMRHVFKVKPNEVGMVLSAYSKHMVEQQCGNTSGLQIPVIDDFGRFLFVIKRLALKGWKLVGTTGFSGQNEHVS